jgi:hypothetical protein
MKYEPEYAKGQILVAFKKCPGRQVAQFFGEHLGYGLMEEEDDYYGAEVFIYRTPEGQERQAIEAFQQQGIDRFIEWAERRDLKLERRWKSLDEAAGMLQELHDDTELPDQTFNQRLQSIVDFLAKQKNL